MYPQIDHEFEDRQTRLTINISAARRFVGLQHRWLTSRTRQACKVLGVQRGELSIRLADNEEMSRLHAEHKGLDSATDVLTFDFADPGSAAEGRIDAEIVVGATVAMSEAVRRGHEPAVEALLYIVHGLLHCLGHDDHDPRQAAAMHRREDEVLRAIGVGSAYRTGG